MRNRKLVKVEQLVEKREKKLGRKGEVGRGEGKRAEGEKEELGLLQISYRF